MRFVVRRVDARHGVAGLAANSVPAIVDAVVLVAPIVDAAAVDAAIVDAALRARLFSLTRLRLLLLLRLLTRLRLLFPWPRLLLRLLSARFGARRGAAVGSTRFPPRLCLFPRLA